MAARAPLSAATALRRASSFIWTSSSSSKLRRFSSSPSFLTASFFHSAASLAFLSAIASWSLRCSSSIFSLFAACSSDLAASVSSFLTLPASEPFIFCSVWFLFVQVCSIRFSLLTNFGTSVSMKAVSPCCSISICRLSLSVFRFPVSPNSEMQAARLASSKRSLSFSCVRSWLRSVPAFLSSSPSSITVVTSGMTSAPSGAFSCWPALQ
jgi:hypothetical protein